MVSLQRPRQLEKEKNYRKKQIFTDLWTVPVNLFVVMLSQGLLLLL